MAPLTKPSWKDRLFPDVHTERGLKKARIGGVLAAAFLGGAFILTAATTGTLFDPQPQAPAEEQLFVIAASIIGAAGWFFAAYRIGKRKGQILIWLVLAYAIYSFATKLAFAPDGPGPYISLLVAWGAINGVRAIRAEANVSKRLWLPLSAVFLVVVVSVWAFSQYSDSPMNRFIVALEENNYGTADQAITDGANVNFAIAGRSLLITAVSYNDASEVDFLIRLGAEVSTRTNFGRTPLHEAALYGFSEIAELLIEAGAEINARNPRGETPLYYSEVGLINGPEHTSAHDRVSELLRAHGGVR